MELSSTSSWHRSWKAPRRPNIVQQDGPIEPQDGPRWVQDGTERAPREPKRAPRWPKKGPRWQGEGAKRVQYGPRRLKIGSRWAKTAQDRLKMGQAKASEKERTNKRKTGKQAGRKTEVEMLTVLCYKGPQRAVRERSERTSTHTWDTWGDPSTMFIAGQVSSRFPFSC